MTSPSRTPGRALTALLESCGDPLGTVMAKKLKVTPMTVYRWKKSEDMSLSRVKELADYFGYSIDEFLNWEESDESGNSDLEPPFDAANYGTRSFT